MIDFDHRGLSFAKASDVSDQISIAPLRRVINSRDVA
jgi:hypothetical protein